MKLSKQLLRSYISTGASIIEIIISFFILIGIVLLCSRIISDIYIITMNIGNANYVITTETFLVHSLELIIGIEFVKMLAKHTPSSAVEVLVFAIARQIITKHTGMVDVLLGVIAIAILFAIRYYLSNSITVSKPGEMIVNGGTTLEEIKSKTGIDIDPLIGNTVAGIIANIAIKNGMVLKPGYSVTVDDHTFEVYSMDAHLIKQVKISSSNNHTFLKK